jgi:hypothetical protein
MASTVTQSSDDKTVEKAVWHYVGVGVLWASLFLTGMAFERLGLTSWILSGVLPGEVGSLRVQTTECTRNLGAVKLERDISKRQEDTLRVEIKKLQDKVAAAIAANPTAATP